MELSATTERPPLFVTPLPTGQTRSPIRRILIANRGEIACRIIATCRKLNLTSIAIYVDEDAGSRHIYEADEAIGLGSITSTDGNPFLNISLLIQTSVKARADAVHPGYGYLSENGDFADAVRNAGMIFVGPSSEAIATLGDKRRSKEYLRKYAPDIPLVPGFGGSSQDVQDLEAAAQEIGYPVMLKASSGGGGRGMRIVYEPTKLQENLERAQSEAKRSFGSSDCILEKYIESAKHIEVQIIGDSHGTVIALWERECSVQRRHQKVIEESPSPFLTSAQRQAMCAAAVQLGKLILYEGAGTVEFVVDTKTGKFYFLEVNTRLQVEHPITEEVTGLDIVALQLFIAAAGNLNDLELLQSIPQHGHAIECRLCAEDAANNFAPEKGTIQLWYEAKLSTGSRDIRYETAVESGSEVSIYFDSMIAKVIVWAPTRNLAIAKMVKILANTACIGVKTNQLFLQSCLLHPGFHQLNYDTSFISSNLEALLRNPHVEEPSKNMGMLSAVPALLVRQIQAHESTKPFKNVRQSFKNQAPDCIDSSAVIIESSESSALLLCTWDTSRDAQTQSLAVQTLADEAISAKDEKPSRAQIVSSHFYPVSQHLRRRRSKQTSPSSEWYKVELRKAGRISTTATHLTLALNGQIIHALTPVSPSKASNLLSPAASHNIPIHFPSLGSWISYSCYSPLTYIESVRETLTASESASTGSQQMVYAPMPCKVLDVLKKEGESVKLGETVMIIESMKMETSISCGVEGNFRCNVGKGEAVDEGKVLCRFEEVKSDKGAE